MEQIIITVLVTLGLGYLRTRRDGAKFERAVKDGAKAIVEDPGNPITDWKSAAKEATKQILIARNQDRIERIAAELEEMQADAKRDAEAALARGRARAEGMEIVHVDPHTGEETKVQ